MADASRLSPAQAAAVRQLAALRKRLSFVMTEAVGPVSMAVQELRNKEGKKPQELDRSSKLFRAIEDIETARESLAESPRLLRRLNTLRGLSHEQVEQVLTRGA